MGMVLNIGGNCRKDAAIGANIQLLFEESLNNAAVSDGLQL